MIDGYAFKDHILKGTAAGGGAAQGGNRRQAAPRP
jgi:hypothetical protein